MGRFLSKSMMKVMFMLALPGVAKRLGMSFIPEEPSFFLIDVIKKTVEHR